MNGIFHWFLTVTGANNPSSTWYGWWSGFAGDIPEFAILGVLYKHFRCQTCWRVGPHKVGGTHYRTCHVHATPEHHARLLRRHAEKYPDQHRLFNPIPPAAPVDPDA